ncbi:hypothetical protein FVEG_17009 [Fusarium verticillioides 7600]|uniref:Uncharacterized protein n=1 Tax=Gibberella moniliformis (strain M3125 / FGSC 7600) TaxID=334819 RepID=W7MY32_GIBM7|nr:hypothetical protein FVEG_17009 [Fusarium verticillioides 7600]XP_018758890.1 hypothetical protein FVEG_17009 [Fusarium verticillioides 7600]XP_018758891.1 hypothetical protein FVEG_17009 [Fusarium verticillioides 7600]XP_018758892.1 hypothetical protein FVEG_17009 [Fusarium verticillioides 7600]XP_018758893.1 hypothetical protein FVEG_17009 [Fusarium verticillioides 7600]XP_018758894.1 hypothetical protein FVEG_17009 [Fusarium verticillioides 7600]EWG52698.1 hypothetical protein FVEG_1700
MGSGWSKSVTTHQLQPASPCLHLSPPSPTKHIAPEPRKKGWKLRKILCRNCVQAYPRSRCRPGRVGPRFSQFRSPPLPSPLGAFQKTFSKPQRKAFIETSIDFPVSNNCSQTIHVRKLPPLQRPGTCLLDTGISHPSWRHESGPCLRVSEEDAVGAVISLQELYRTASHC